VAGVSGETPGLKDPFHSALPDGRDQSLKSGGRWRIGRDARRLGLRRRRWRSGPLAHLDTAGLEALTGEAAIETRGVGIVGAGVGHRACLLCLERGGAGVWEILDEGVELALLDADGPRADADEPQLALIDKLGKLSVA